MTSLTLLCGLDKTVLGIPPTRRKWFLASSPSALHSRVWTCPYLRSPPLPPRDHRWRPSFQPDAWTHPVSHRRGTGCRTSPRRTCFWEWPEGIESWASPGFQGPLGLIPFHKGPLFKKRSGNHACKGSKCSHTNTHSFIHWPTESFNILLVLGTPLGTGSQ